MKYESWGKTYELSFRKGHYQNNSRLAIQVMCKEEGEDWYEPFCTLTVNLEDSIQIQDNRAYIDTNNCPKDLIQSLEEQGVMTKTRIAQQSGYCVYPLYEFNQEWLNKLSDIH